jgi:hypothetical protein
MVMNDFLRPCNCVHPADEDCEKCAAEASPEKKADVCCGKENEKSETSAPTSPDAKKSEKP